MGNDHLDTETSVSASLTERGVEARAKSRTIAAIDRLGGNLLELINTPLERRAGRQRAILQGEKTLIEAVAQYAAERLNRDPEFAQQALEQHFKQIFRMRENKDAVIVEALEDLRRESPTDDEATTGNPQLDEQFMGRFERYADEASTEELQQRWGRVLAREIRKPGTFSFKALRVIDEMESDTAKLFEQLCASRLDDILPRADPDEVDPGCRTSATS